MFGTDNAMDTTMTSARKSSSVDDEDEIEVVGLSVVGVLRLELEVAMVGSLEGWE